jgi:surfeit locus 1 family protein
MPHAPAAEAPARGSRSAAALVALGLVAGVVFAGLMALGTWQVERRAWKLALIAQVDQRVHAPPVAAPGPARWPQVTAASDAYRHVQVTGRFVAAADTLVQASTDLGAGFWVLTPLRREDDGSVVLINRGFVAAEQRDRAARGAAVSASADAVTVTGLLRITEPEGGFLRRNDAAANRWYSRDVPAIAAARGLGRVAPYFIDADAAPDSSDEPVGGLTVIAFNNHHAVYAITWYLLALMVAAGAGHMIREELKLRRQGRPGLDPADHDAAPS